MCEIHRYREFICMKSDAVLSRIHLMYEMETCWNEMCLQAIFMAKYVLFVRVCSNVGYHVAKYREIVWWKEENECK